MSNVKPIEIYEWPEGGPHPSTMKPRETCIDFLEAPPNGVVPAVGDIVLLNVDGADFMSATRFRVIEREFLWGRMPKQHHQEPATWSKVWLHVRRVVGDR
jgi:hypothetical protein